MTQDNSLFQLDNQSYQTKKQFASVQFEDELKKLPKPDWQNKKRKYRYTTFAEKNRENTVAWQIDSQEKLFTKIDRNPNGVLKIILDIRTIYIKYLNQANNANKQYNQIQTVILRLK